ncbi:MAG: glycosyltransferase family 4 protein [Actinomycetota bacterium]
MRIMEVLGMSAGGIARHVATLQRGLDGQAGLEITVAGPADLPEKMPGAFQPVVIPDGPFGHRDAVRRLTELAESFDVCHGHGLRAGIDSAFAARKVGAAAFATIHNLVRPEIAGRWRAPLYAYAERMVVRLNDRIFCVSEEIASHLRRRVPREDADKIEVAYLGVEPPPEPGTDAATVRANLGIQGGVPLIVTVARLSPQKALHVMLDAVALLPDAHLAILGEGPLRAELEDHARRVLPGRAVFLGYRNDAIDHVAAADVFCLSSVWEGVPLAVMEAILVGVPIVSTDVGGMSEIITDGRSGRLVPPNDAAALARALSDVLSDPEMRRSYRAAAREHVSERFSVQRMLAHLAEAYGAARA